ncbi:DUF5681 domain-containing protein [Methylobacterium oxalidis]|uniref:DUF5681 domain-containing protein n=1 Tax=Methylobacterium oxalidis TaxID=944322 RepID=A0A512J9Z2_9HYPH|nr:DUF5681 domain-containing protein [Methylobacterium oxalidis]GEP06780.1 hypothetical protein MOX02_48180 [Methylobacterium oxalidis]GJE34469.1 hypothetical protein LDDCCGHA_4680 [Methylobacterium oxalidis]GLS67084.1 hypothetical protein GCM10007888_54670 [Methylobacterium oxalidis]
MSKKPSRHPSADRTPEYEVGYGCPPLASRFKPGQCGNPKGRPKKAQSLAAATERELERIVVVREDGREKRLTKREVIGRRIVNDACRGDLRATRLLRDLTGVSGPTGTAVPAGSNMIAPASLPVDATDQAIIAEFAALIRTGAALVTSEDVLAAELLGSDAQGHEDAVVRPPSPTSH